MSERLGIAGSGAIATGLAATASVLGDVVLVARSDASADRARATIEKLCGRVEGADASRVTVTTDSALLADRTFVVEAIAEELDAKKELLAKLAGIIAPDAVLGSTTSSLSVATLAQAAGVADRFVGLHVFNPVTMMKLVELAYADAATSETRGRAFALCEALGKTPVDVPDTPGFVVNRLLFPYLFSAAAFLEESGMEPKDVDTCMKLGAGHPMGPLALLDFVGLDVSIAIGETIGADIPANVRALAAEGHLGKKSGKGFYDYAR
ncbi:3-hydroxyacyl-CoA dehydrogenase family protein [Conexibacter sp. W3-3-2]|uniref:3-hydroxyacyl-CoA dehydrogenase family protein n=1 Tax=Conexibacter sp. W3-3-2 TaxID=2675227 RepID=UPI0013269432|nr:3-hydroxyacyl-CoA dehydrogenase NAD-binding domain-containing protein [Conexibacter sp. W3-3-2]MTD46958.1 3-hydroxyacyl-CoA dehydrogenase family protein [Conexibacter sp. W3-3-2]